MTGGAPRLIDPGTDSPAERVAEALRRRGGTASAAEVGEDLGIHTSTARFHLDHLVEEGRVRMSREKRSTRGRPRTLFTLSPDPTEGPRAYQMLAGVLVSHLARREDAARLAAQAGVEWGRRFRGEGVETLLTEVGFAPAADQARPGRIELRHCPFIDLAMDHPGVVCPLHRGVVEGAVGHPVRLEAHPGGICIVDLGGSEDPDDEGRS